MIHKAVYYTQDGSMYYYTATKGSIRDKKQWRWNYNLWKNQSKIEEKFEEKLRKNWFLSTIVGHSPCSPTNTANTTPPVYRSFIRPGFFPWLKFIYLIAVPNWLTLANLQIVFSHTAYDEKWRNEKSIIRWVRYVVWPALAINLPVMIFITLVLNQ